MVARGIEANEAEILSHKDEEGYIEYLPNSGEFIALDAANSVLHFANRCFYIKQFSLI